MTPDRGHRPGVIRPGEYQTLAGLENTVGPAGHRRLVVTRRQFSAAPEHRRHGGLTSIAEWCGTLAGSRTHAGQVSVDILDRNGRLHSSIELGYTGGRPGYDARYSLTTIRLEEVGPDEEVTGEPEFIAELHDHHGTYQLRVVRAPDPAGHGQDQRPGRDMEVLTGPGRPAPPRPRLSRVRPAARRAGAHRRGVGTVRRLGLGQRRLGAPGLRPPDGGAVTCPETTAVTPGMPVHLRDLSAQDGELTRCGLFAEGMPGRVSGHRDDVNCADCLNEGPATAWVILPDGRAVDRRSAALAQYLFAVAVPGRASGGSAWRLGCWAKDPGEARTWCSTRYARDAQIVQVQLAGHRKGGTR